MDRKRMRGLCDGADAIAHLHLQLHGAGILWFAAKFAGGRIQVEGQWKRCHWCPRVRWYTSRDRPRESEILAYLTLVRVAAIGKNRCDNLQRLGKHRQSKRAPCSSTAVIV